MCLKNINDIRRDAGLADISEADLLIAEAIGRDRAFVLAHPDYRPGIFQYLKIRRYLRGRKVGRPIAQIIGHKEFFGLDFLVDKNVLIPRPETELMVEEAIKEIRKHLPAGKAGKTENGILLIDVGTGSGCVPISIIKTLKHKNIKTFTIDISRSALRLARKNARRYSVDIELLHGNLLAPIVNKSLLEISNLKLVITANLPYLTAEQFKKEPSIRREPRLALVADNSSGLSLYEKLFGQIQSLLLIANCYLLVIIEIDPRQSSAALALANKYFPKSKIEIKKDLAGHDRLVLIVIRGPNSTQ